MNKAVAAALAAFAVASLAAMPQAAADRHPVSWEFFQEWRAWAYDTIDFYKDRISELKSENADLKKRPAAASPTAFDANKVASLEKTIRDLRAENKRLSGEIDKLEEGKKQQEAPKEQASDGGADRDKNSAMPVTFVQDYCIDGEFSSRIDLRKKADEVVAYNCRGHITDGRIVDADYYETATRDYEEYGDDIIFNTGKITLIVDDDGAERIIIRDDDNSREYALDMSPISKAGPSKTAAEKFAELSEYDLEDNLIEGDNVFFAGVFGERYKYTDTSSDSAVTVPTVFGMAAIIPDDLSRHVLEYKWLIDAINDAAQVDHASNLSYK